MKIKNNLTNKIRFLFQKNETLTRRYIYSQLNRNWKDIEDSLKILLDKGEIKRFKAPNSNFQLFSRTEKLGVVKL